MTPPTLSLLEIAPIQLAYLTLVFHSFQKEKTGCLHFRAVPATNAATSATMLVGWILGHVWRANTDTELQRSARRPKDSATTVRRVPLVVFGPLD